MKRKQYTKGAEDAERVLECIEEQNKIRDRVTSDRKDNPKPNNKELVNEDHS